MELYRQYKFVIAFENSRANDYVTEKFYDPLLAGAVPIYLGAPNIETFAPGENCSVDIRNFSSPKELAAFLIEACKNEKIYNKFLQWKKEPLKPEFMKKIEAQRVHPFIRLCHLLHLPPPTSRYYGARKKMHTDLDYSSVFYNNPCFFLFQGKTSTISACLFSTETVLSLTYRQTGRRTGRNCMAFGYLILHIPYTSKRRNCR